MKQMVFDPLERMTFLRCFVLGTLAFLNEVDEDCPQKEMDRLNWDHRTRITFGVEVFSLQETTCKRASCHDAQLQFGCNSSSEWHSLAGIRHFDLNQGGVCLVWTVLLVERNVSWKSIPVSRRLNSVALCKRIWLPLFAINSCPTHSIQIVGWTAFHRAIRRYLFLGLVGNPIGASHSFVGTFFSLRSSRLTGYCTCCVAKNLVWNQMASTWFFLFLNWIAKIVRYAWEWLEILVCALILGLIGIWSHNTCNLDCFTGIKSPESWNAPQCWVFLRCGETNGERETQIWNVSNVLGRLVVIKGSSRWAAHFDNWSYIFRSQVDLYLWDVVFTGPANDPSHAT